MRIRTKQITALYSTPLRWEKLGIESKSTLYTEQVEFIESASLPRRLGSFMRQNVPGKTLIEKSYIRELKQRRF